MYNRNIIQQAKQLRKKDSLILKLIKIRNKIAKNTLSYWSRDIILPNWYKDKVIKLIKKFNKGKNSAMSINKIKEKNSYFF